MVVYMDPLGTDVHARLLLRIALNPKPETVELPPKT